jgi:hypothetical protein
MVNYNNFKDIKEKIMSKTETTKTQKKNHRLWKIFNKQQNKMDIIFYKAVHLQFDPFMQKFLLFFSSKIIKY